MKSGRFHVKHTSWEESERALRAVRTAVFIEEQSVPEEEEWEARDEGALHALAVATECEAAAGGIPRGTGFDTWLDTEAGRVAGTAIGTARLNWERPDGAGEGVPAVARVCRMAVLRSWRGRGVGDALLQELLAVAARRGCREVILDAQVVAIPFYARHGFVAEGPTFLDAGIPHRLMRKPLVRAES